MTYLYQVLSGHERVSLGSGIRKLNFLIIYPGDASVDLSVVFQLKGCLSIDSRVVLQLKGCISNDEGYLTSISSPCPMKGVFGAKTYLNSVLWTSFQSK